MNDANAASAMQHAGTLQHVSEGVRCPLPATQTNGHLTADVPKKKYKHHYKPTGNHVGRPTKAEAEFRKQIKADSLAEARPRAPKFGPPVPIGLGWGGARRGAGRPRRIGPPKKQNYSIIRMDTALGESLKVLPRGKRSEYLRRAVELMTDIQPPEKFLLALGEKTEQTDSSVV